MGAQWIVIAQPGIALIPIRIEVLVPHSGSAASSG